MSGQIGKATFPTTDYDAGKIDKINIIKAFRDFAKAMEWDSSEVYDRRYNLEERISHAKAELHSLENQLAQVNEELEAHKVVDPFFYSDRLDEVVQRYRISKRAEVFLTNTGSGLKEQKDAVELMIACGEILGKE